MVGGSVRSPSDGNALSQGKHRQESENKGEAGADHGAILLR